MGRGITIAALVVIVTCPLALANMAVPQRGDAITATLVSPVSPSHPANTSASPRDFSFDATTCSPGDWQARYEAISRSPFGQLGPGALPSDLGSDANTTAVRLERDRDPQVIELPPAPGGGTLALSGLMTLGAWQAARSARSAKFASLFHGHALPEWYHPNAVRIGHSVPFEFQLTLQPILSYCGLLAADSSSILHQFATSRFDDVVPFRSGQYILLATAPRGPPLFA